MLGGLAGGQVLATAGNSDSALVLPPSQEEPFEDVVELRVGFPVVSGKSGDTHELEVEVRWIGGERRVFDLTATPPPGWKADIFSGAGKYPEVKIGAIVMEARKFSGTKVKIKVEPLPGNFPEPGDYPVMFEVSSEDIRETVELAAKVTAKYEFEMRTPTLQLNTEVTAGKDNPLTVLLVNSGSDPIENLSLASTKPEGWDITYEPDKIESLAPGTTQELDVTITPPKETIAGDWSITLRANSEQASDSLDLRVTVLTPTIWGWVGILIVVLVIAGVGVVFWRLGRR